MVTSCYRDLARRSSRQVHKFLDVRVKQTGLTIEDSLLMAKNSQPGENFISSIGPLFGMLTRQLKGVTKRHIHKDQFLTANFFKDCGTRLADGHLVFGANVLTSNEVPRRCVKENLKCENDYRLHVLDDPSRSTRRWQIHEVLDNKTSGTGSVPWFLLLVCPPRCSS